MLANVRQSGVLSPTVFAVLIDCVINKLRMSGKGTYIRKFYFGSMQMTLCWFLTLLPARYPACVGLFE